MAKRLCLFVLALFVWRLACADVHFRHFEEDDEPQWQEAETSLPAFPKDEDLLEFYVSAGTSNHFYIDGKSISPGTDGVVRFTLVIKTAGGATNVSFEGIRCGASGAQESRYYATGSNGAWVKARNSAWKPIENKPVNGYYAALSRNYFCPSTLPIQSAEEGRDALRRGRHPNAR
ncbi:MAG TPA: CNP1-like family protein [Rhodocyclaceae bacterium]